MIEILLSAEWANTSTDKKMTFYSVVYEGFSAEAEMFGQRANGLFLQAYRLKSIFNFTPLVLSSFDVGINTLDSAQSVGINMPKNKTSNFITIRQSHNLCFIIIIHYYITNTLQTQVSCKYMLLSYKTTVNIPTVLIPTEKRVNTNGLICIRALPV